MPALLASSDLAICTTAFSAIDEDLADKRKADPISAAESTADKAKRMAHEAAKKLAVESLLSQRAKYARELGEKLRASGDSIETAALTDELRLARKADVRVEAMKVEIATLSRQTPQLVKRLALVAASTVVLLVGYWGYGFVASLRHSMRAEHDRHWCAGGKPANPGGVGGFAAKERTGGGRAIRSAKARRGEKFAGHRRVAATTREGSRRKGTPAQASCREKRLEFEQRRLDAEKQAKQAELARQQGDSDRRMQSATNEATGMVERQHLADELFGTIVLDPAKGVQVSRTLKQRYKATVELRGPKYLEIAEMHAKRNWLGVINLVSNNAFFDLPDAPTIEKAVQTLGDYKFTMLLRTSAIPSKGYNGPSLFLISFPLQFGQSHRYGEAVAATNRWERHPDGIGYFHEWHPSDGYSVVALATPDVVNRSVRQVNTDVRQKLDVLQTKLKLGEIDEATVQLETATVLARIREQVSAWAAGQ